MKLPEFSANTDPWAEFEGHERVVVAEDPATGLKAVIAIHSTALGPALGGTRMSMYADSDRPGAAAYADALRLSRAMSYKNALAGLDHGGGKGVIINDPRTRTDDVLRAYGRLVESLGGMYVTAADLGITVHDMDLIGEACRWTTGRSPERGGVGDSGILTAVGVWHGMRACAQTVWGDPTLAGRTVGIIGSGKVGGRLAGHLAEEGARVLVVEPSPIAVEALCRAHPGIEVVGSVDELLARGPDILSPNAVGGLLTPELAGRLPARIVCGGANNQLSDPSVAALLAARGVLYAPDFLVNCGGVIQVAEELHGADLGRARARVDEVFATTLRVLERAAAEGITPLAAAEAEAEDRMAGAASGSR